MSEASGVTFTFSEQDHYGNWIATAWIDNQAIAKERFDVTAPLNGKSFFHAVAIKLPNHLGSQQEKVELLFEEFDHAVRLARPSKKRATDLADPVPERPPLPKPITYGELLEENPRLHQEVIHNLARRCETVNLISPSKMRQIMVVLSSRVMRRVRPGVSRSICVRTGKGSDR